MIEKQTKKKKARHFCRAPFTARAKSQAANHHLRVVAVPACLNSVVRPTFKVVEFDHFEIQQVWQLPHHNSNNRRNALIRAAWSASSGTTRYSHHPPHRQNLICQSTNVYES